MVGCRTRAIHPLESPPTNVAVPIVVLRASGITGWLKPLLPPVTDGVIWGRSEHIASCLACFVEVVAVANVVLWFEL